MRAFLQSLLNRGWSVPEVRAAIVCLGSLLIGASLLFVFGLLFQVGQLNPLGGWSVLIVVAIAAAAGGIAWRNGKARGSARAPHDTLHAASRAEVFTAPTRPTAAVIEDPRPRPRRAGQGGAGSVVSLKRQFDDAYLKGDFVLAERCLDEIERSGTDNGWIAVKRDLLRDRRARS